jgi:hypothetical protein
MINKKMLEDQLENFKEPLRVCARQRNKDGSDKQFAGYLRLFKGVERDEARAMMDAWLAGEAKKSENDNQRVWWGLLRRDLAARP